MKNYGKLLSFAFLTFFISISSAFAKELTLSEFEKEVEKVQKDSGYVYIIGNYAFTSLHTLTTEDVMLAARSIALEDKDGYTDKDASYKKMTMHMLQRTYDDDFNPIGWQKKANVLGQTELKDDAKLNIRYIDYTFIPEVSKATISVDVEKEEFKKYKDVLENSLNFKSEIYYGKNSDGTPTITYDNGKVSGLLLKKNEIYLSELDKEKYKDADYFFAYILEVPNANQKTKINVTNINGTKEINWNEFDVKETTDGNVPGIVILTPIDRNKWQKGGDNQKVTIKVDVDGDDVEYEETTYTLDLSNLTFQGDSTANVKLSDPSSKDKEILQGWGYDSSKNKNLELNEGKLTGSLFEQILESSEAFGEENKDGYYFDFKFDLPEGVTKGQTKISQVKSDKDQEILKTFDEKEYDEDGNLTILYRFSSNTSCEESEENCKLYFQLDYDGEGDKYLPTIYTIDYSGVTFVKYKKIDYTYKDKTGKTITETDKAHEGDQIVKVLSEEDTKYRTFDGWYDSKGEKVDKIPTVEPSSENTITLTAHWNINADEFISEVVEDLNSENTTYSDNFSGKIDLKQDETNKNEITINVDKPNVSLTELAETSIPGSIAYILDKDEIKDITLTVGSQTVQFNKEYEANNGKEYVDETERNLLTENAKTLKTEIVKGAKKAFDDDLSGNEAKATLDQIEYDGKSFTLTIGDIDDTVTLVDSEGNEISDAEKTYTFNFDSDFVVVDTDGELGATDLKEALGKNYTKVYLNSDIIVESPISIEKQDAELSIEPLETETSPVVVAANMLLAKEISEPSTDEESKTISVTSGDYAIDVKSGNVTLKDINLSGGSKSELKVEEGATVVVDNLSLSGTKVVSEDEKTNFNAGITVEGNLTVSNLTNNDESYDNPAIRIPANKVKSAKVNLNGLNMTEKSVYTYVKKGDGTSDEPVSVTDKTYYLNSEDSKLYVIGFRDLKFGKSGYVFQEIKYYHNGEQSGETLKTDVEKLTNAYKTTHTNEQYIFKGWYKKHYEPGQIPDGEQPVDFDKETLSEGTNVYYAGYDLATTE